MKRLDVLIADDHPIFVLGLQTILQQHSEFSFDVVQIARTGKEALEYLQQQPVDLLLLDLSMPEMDGLELLKVLRRKRLGCKTIVLSMYNNPKLVKLAMKRGSSAFLYKSNASDELARALEAVMAGDIFLGDTVWLPGAGVSGQRKRRSGANHLEEGFLAKYRITKREREVLQLIVQGLNNREIADHLFISEQTVHVHRKNMMRKLDVGNTASLVRMAYECQLLL